jgi:hypothetical protein
MVNNNNEAMPMKFVSKDTNDQAMPMMDVNKDITAGTKPESANKETRPSLYTSTS